MNTDRYGYMYMYVCVVMFQCHPLLLQGENQYHIYAYYVSKNKVLANCKTSPPHKFT